VGYRPGDTLGPRVLGDYELVLILDGHVSYSCNGEEFKAHPGTVIFSRMGFSETYRWDPERETRHIYCHFDVDRVPSYWPVMGSWPIVFTRVDPVVATLFHHVIQLCRSHPTWPSERPSVTTCRVVEVLMTALLQKPESELALSRPESVQRATQYMRRVLDEASLSPVTLKDLADAASISPKHLCRLFHQSLGCSPMQACRYLRLQLAVVLLSRSNLSVKQIGSRCGFTTPHHFSRCFAQTFGKAPSLVRRQVFAGQPPPVVPLPADLMPRLYW